MPANGYTDADVEFMLTNFFQNNPNVAPANGHNRFYAVISPPGLDNSLSYGGQHQHFTFNSIGCVYTWVDGNDSLKDVAVFGHELVEGCSNPTLRGSSNGNGIKAPGTDSGGNSIPDGSDEIGDACEQASGYATVWVNQLQCTLQGYWSEADNACVLPLGAVTLLMNKNTFGKDEVQEAINNALPGATQAIFANAFWVAFDKYSQNTLSSFNITIPTPTFSDLNGNPVTIPGVTILLTPATSSAPNPVLEAPADNTSIQRMRWSFDVVFDIPLQPTFPSQYLLNATYLMDGNQPPGGTRGHSQDVVNIDLVAGADPYFSNIDVEDSSAVSYLSQDLRVCKVVAGGSALPNDPNAPVFSASELALHLHSNFAGLFEPFHGLYGSRAPDLARSPEWSDQPVRIRNRPHLGDGAGWRRQSELQFCHRPRANDQRCSGDAGRGVEHSRILPLVDRSFL